MANIQWFPGHMNKARNLLAKYIEKVDAVLEVVDARIPQSSRSPLLADICRSKPLVVLLNKFDLADRDVVNQWISYFRECGNVALPVSAKNSAGLPKLRAKIYGMSFPKRVSSRVRRWVIVGVPNSGKSTLINVLSRRKCARTADTPGVTRDLAIYKLGNGVELIDSPGTLCPKFSDQMVAARLAALGLIKEGIYSACDVLEMVYPYLRECYEMSFCERYQVNKLPDVYAFMGIVAQRLRRSLSDRELVANHILSDLRDGRYGPVCLEKPKYMENINVVSSMYFGCK